MTTTYSTALLWLFLTILCIASIGLFTQIQGAQKKWNIDRECDKMIGASFLGLIISLANLIAVLITHATAP